MSVWALLCCCLSLTPIRIKKGGHTLESSCMQSANLPIFIMCQHAALGLSTIKHRCTLTAISSGWAVKRNGWSRTTVAMSAWTRCSSLTTAANVGGKSSLWTKERAKAIRNAWRRRRRRKRKVEMMKMCRYNYPQKGGSRPTFLDFKFF